MINNFLYDILQGMRERELRRGIHTVLTSVQERKVGESAVNTVRRLLTLDGRIPLNQARQSITPTENWIIDRLIQKPSLQLRTPTPDDCVVIQERLAPHISILQPYELASYQMTKHHFIAGGIPLDRADWQDLRIRSQEDTAHFKYQTQRVTAELKAMEKTDELRMTIS